MNRLSMRTVARHLGLGTALVCSVTLLTLIFSFLGTITCAVLVGMMFASGRGVKWEAIPASLVFPAVIVAFMPSESANLSRNQCVLLPIICLGAFWIAFMATLAVRYLEEPAGDAIPPQSRPRPCRETPVVKPGESQCRFKTASSPAVPPSGPPAGAPELEELQGEWQTLSPDGRETLVVVRDIITWRVQPVDGRDGYGCRARLEPALLGPFNVVRLVQLEVTNCGPGTPLELPGTLIFKVVGDALIVASNFENAARDRSPRVETYLKVKPDECIVWDGAQT
jgi:hypothetical protein